MSNGGETIESVYVLQNSLGVFGMKMFFVRELSGTGVKWVKKQHKIQKV